MKKNDFYKNKVILVTGGVGSIGREIVRRLLKYYNPKVIRVLDNNETGLFDLEQELQTKKIRLLVGDIRDKERLKRGMEEVDIVFHAAALKHVSLCEFDPFEAVQTNVMGTQNVIDAALDTRVKKMINISTDKAVNPINVMGATKLLTERLITSANYYKGKKKTIFSSVRFGNVLNSQGSMIPLFHRQIKKGGPVTVTDLNMKRFVMNIPKAVDLVLKVAQIAKGKEIFILKMPILRIKDLVEVMIDELAPKYDYKPEQIEIKIIGKREGEKFCEELITEREIANAYETKKMFIIYPDKKKKDAIKTFSPASAFLKKKQLLSKKEIKELLNKTLTFSEKK